MQLEIRPARVEDAAAVSELVRRSITVCCTADHGGDAALIARWTANKTPENVRHWLAAAGSIALVAHHSGQVVGFALVAGDELALCYVSPEVLHHGVGKALLREATLQVYARGVQVLRLDSTQTALAFYLRNGFSVQGPPRHWAGLEAQPMSKALGAP